MGSRLEAEQKAPRSITVFNLLAEVNSVPAHTQTSVCMSGSDTAVHAVSIAPKNLRQALLEEALLSS